MKFKRVKTVNKIIYIRPALKDLLKIKTDDDFHDFLVSQALKTYIEVCKQKNKKLGTVLAVGSNQVEARNLPKYDFDKIILSNFPALDKTTKEAIDKRDTRIKEDVQLIESLNLKSESCDYVFCKETLHHIPCPPIGLYEMLRVCKNAVSFIEPQENLITRILEKLGLATKYEGFDDPRKEPKIRKIYHVCFLYRWSPRELIKLLQSYYLESGYQLYLNSFWLSNRKIFGIHIAGSKFFKILGWLISFLPFSRGNFLIATIVPGNQNHI